MNNKELAEKIADLLDERNEFANEIDIKMGGSEMLEWQCGNMAAQTMMDELKNTIDRGVSLQKIENALRSL